jgi:hypothetical protein
VGERENPLNSKSSKQDTNKPLTKRQRRVPYHPITVEKPSNGTFNHPTQGPRTTARIQPETHPPALPPASTSREAPTKEMTAKSTQAPPLRHIGTEISKDIPSSSRPKLQTPKEMATPQDTPTSQETTTPIPLRDSEQTDRGDSRLRRRRRVDYHALADGRN